MSGVRCAAWPAEVQCVLLVTGQSGASRDDREGAQENSATCATRVLWPEVVPKAYLSREVVGSPLCVFPLGSVAPEHAAQHGGRPVSCVRLSGGGFRVVCPFDKRGSHSVRVV